MTRWLLALLIVLAFTFVACGGDAPDSTASNPSVTQQGQQSQGQAQVGSVGGSQSSDVGSTTTGATLPPGEPVKLTAAQLQEYKPNELGEIPVLEYHQIDSPPEQFTRTPDQFRGDLQWLYDHGFYVVNLNDILTDNLNVPAGKKPVALTFDDSPAGQFRLQKLTTGQYAIDPNCAVGILEAFFGEYPDFGRGGHFAVLPNMLFDWTLTVAEEDQTPLAQSKLRWLLDHGYEIGNHTLEHVNLGDLTDDQIKYQLAGANDAIQQIVPDANVEVVTLPFGVYPDGGDDRLLRGFDYNGKHYAWKAALLVGANPTYSPISTEFDPYSIARIQAFDDELDKWFGVFEDNPGLLYVSDGNPNTVTVPNDLHSWIVGTLDASKIGNRELIRY